MKFFDYDKNASNVEYYEILEDLMERWEHEIVELKEAKGGYDADKIGCYFSEIMLLTAMQGQPAKRGL